MEGILTELAKTEETVRNLVSAIRKTPDAVYLESFKDVLIDGRALIESSSMF